MKSFHRRDVLAGMVASGLLVGGRVLGVDEHAAVVEGAKKEGTLGFATSVSAGDFPKFMDAFKAKYPFLDVTSGYYSAPTGRVLARVGAELDAGNLSFDVLHVANLVPYLAMARSGQLLPYASPELAAFPDDAHGGDFWTTARVIGVIMAYNKNVLAPEKAPTSWADMLRPEFAQGKLVIQDSAAGTSFNQMYMLEKLFGLDFMKKWGAQKPIVVSTAPQLIDLLVRGEALVGGTVDHFRAFEPNATKAGIVGVYPTEGMPLAVAPVAIFKAAPHPNAAKLFIDFTLSRAGGTLLDHDIFQAYSRRPDVPPPEGQRPLAETKPLLPQDLADYERASAEFPEHFDQIFRA